MADSSRPDSRIPVYLLTGYLGSGKTSLLKSWLAQPELADAALVINELGEVGLDNQLLSAASESSALVANACVCCTGLPGLEEALEDLFWARLQRRIPRFPHLVIETTGLAEPAPVVAALRGTELLRERYRLAGVITCLSAATADVVLRSHAEARAQLAGADLLVVTKTDLLSADALEALLLRLRHQLAHEQASTRLATSALASLSAAHMLQGLTDRSGQVPQADSGKHAQQALGHAHPHPHPSEQDPGHAQSHEHEHEHEHEHSAQAYWWAMPDPVSGQELLAQIADLQASLGPVLLRLKGHVLTEQGLWLVQLAPFESAPLVEPATLGAGAEVRTGLTVIVALPLSPAQANRLQALLVAS